MTQTFEQYATVAGRALLASIFIISGIEKIGGFTATAGYMAAYGMPWPELLLAGTIVVEIVGGLFLLVGFQARLSATALVLFTAAASVVFHAFWGIDDPQQAYVERLMFMKNASIIGGLLLVAARGAGAISVDRRAR